MLRQEAAFFDASAKSGALLQGLNEDTSAIQLAIGEKVLLLCQTCGLTAADPLLMFMPRVPRDVCAPHPANEPGD